VCRFLEFIIMIIQPAATEDAFKKISNFVFKLCFDRFPCFNFFCSKVNQLLLGSANWFFFHVDLLSLSGYMILMHVMLVRGTFIELLN